MGHGSGPGDEKDLENAINIPSPTPVQLRPCFSRGASVRSLRPFALSGFLPPGRSVFLLRGLPTNWVEKRLLTNAWNLQ